MPKTFYEHSFWTCCSNPTTIESRSSSPKLKPARSIGIPLELLRTLTEADALPGLTLAATPDEAHARLEEAYLTRGRILFEREADDIGTLRAADPGDVLPAIVLVAALDQRPNRRLESLLRLAEPYGIGGLLLGRWPSGTTCHVDGEGQVIAVEGELAGRLNNACLVHITESQAAEYGRLIAASHGAHNNHLPSESRHRGAPEIPKQSLAAQEGESPPVSLLLLGPPEVRVGDRLIPLARREKAFELLVYLALHPGATRKHLLKVLWPGDFPGDFHSTLRHLRDPLKQATGLKEKLFIRHENDRYWIMEDLIDVDVWRLYKLLSEAHAAENDEARIEVLEKVARLCRGVALDGAEFDWCERDGWPLTRAMADALVQLARLQEESHPDRAMELLAQALTLDPDSEETYHDLIALQRRLGLQAEAGRTAKALKHRLAAFGSQP
ncbi:hypothetical protein HII36_09665 [Nonomuraea sp. NN258]|uniref:AfsR/SARP family transcriptional regulator n=1 Tax=Nonomuraea antri TaxID=2730852 RepID=UPI00156A5E0C|nr:hypothetical protein [Nonomuraea antri]NRQ32103.1 hypothetical protein [Nonomuraea antri]